MVDPDHNTGLQGPRGRMPEHKAQEAILREGHGSAVGFHRMKRRVPVAPEPDPAITCVFVGSVQIPRLPVIGIVQGIITEMNPEGIFPVNPDFPGFGGIGREDYIAQPFQAHGSLQIQGFRNTEPPRREGETIDPAFRGKGNRAKGQMLQATTPTGSWIGGGIGGMDGAFQAVPYLHVDMGIDVAGITCKCDGIPRHENLWRLQVEPDRGTVLGKLGFPEAFLQAWMQTIQMGKNPEESTFVAEIEGTAIAPVIGTHPVDLQSLIGDQGIPGTTMNGKIPAHVEPENARFTKIRDHTQGIQPAEREERSKN